MVVDLALMTDAEIGARVRLLHERRTTVMLREAHLRQLARSVQEELNTITEQRFNVNEEIGAVLFAVESD